MLDHGWYHWFSWVIALGETTVGILLIVGAFAGLAALAGAFLNFNFMLAGSASINPVLFVIALLILFGWKVAGWIGVDRWLLPALGTPWQPGRVFRRVLKGRVANEECPVCQMPVDPARVARIRIQRLDLPLMLPGVQGAPGRAASALHRRLWPCYSRAGRGLARGAA